VVPSPGHGLLRTDKVWNIPIFIIMTVLKVATTPSRLRGTPPFQGESWSVVQKSDRRAAPLQQRRGVPKGRGGHAN